MKCSKAMELIADGHGSDELRGHVASCDSCRGLSELVSKLSAAGAELGSADMSMERQRATRREVARILAERATHRSSVFPSGFWAAHRVIRYAAAIVALLACALVYVGYRDGADGKDVAVSDADAAARLESEIESLRGRIGFDVRHFEEKHGLDRRESVHGEMAAALLKRIDICSLRLTDEILAVTSEKRRRSVL